MIDLSYLTEEEQEKIVSVLKRDAELKKADEQRIKRLQRSVPDKVKLKCMTGEWFYQTKSLRHKDRIHGSNVIRAAMRQEKAMTILELTQMWAETPSFVNSAIQDIFVPAELSGLIEEPSGTGKRSSGCISPVALKDEIMQIMKSPEKMIQKHFDSVFEESEVSEGTGEQLAKWEAEHMVSFDEGLLPPSKSHVGSLVKVSAEDEGSEQAVISETAPLPKLRTPSLDSMLDIRDESFSKWSDAMVEQNSISIVPKGILKHSSSCGLADFPVLFSEIENGPCSEFLDTQEPERNDRPAQRSESLHSLDRKQVRFSAVVSMNELEDQTPTLSDGESGGHDLLEMQQETHSEGKDGARELGVSSFMGESMKYLTDGNTASEFQEESGDGHSDMTVPESIPGEITSPPVYEPQTGGLGVKWEEEDRGETESDGEGTEKRDEDIGPSKRAGGQHEHDAVAPTQCFEDQKGIDESQSPVETSKQISARPIAVSKSLEDITSEEMISPVASTPSSSFSEREQIKKRCASLPAFLHGERDGRDSDSGSESNFHFGGRHSSASTNFSTSSGMASMSSASSSLMSIYSQELENLDVKGSIQFSLSYVEKVRELHVLVIRCRDLAIADAKKNRSDPYVKSYLLPDKGKLGKKKTSVKKKTVNPIYNEILRYKIDLETLKSQVLNLSVWHHNSFGRNNFLGEVDFQLSEWDLSNKDMNDCTLKSKVPLSLQPADQRGEIRLALRFLQQCSIGKRTPKNGLVQIFVKECTNLPLIKGTVIDPFVKCFVLPDTNRKSRQKSRVLRRTSNPVFNHTMVYDGFRAEDLQDACVELTVWDHDRLNNHFIGGIRLNLGTGRSYGAAVHWMDSNAAEALLWERMINAQNEWVEENFSVWSSLEQRKLDSTAGASQSDTIR
ncbi:hypothetical protein GJAV_G00138690 [Gymnothorax javanicus]|nr:hypothetical protein GJAV_G00138690 [Gymnothorax javanicus]